MTGGRGREGGGDSCVSKNTFTEDLCDVSVNVGISTQSICAAQTKLWLYEDGPARVLLLLLKNQNQNNLSAKYEEIPAACPWDITFTFSSPLVLIEFFISCPFNFFFSPSYRGIVHVNVTFLWILMEVTGQKHCNKGAQRLPECARSQMFRTSTSVSGIWEFTGSNKLQDAPLKAELWPLVLTDCEESLLSD